MIFGTRIGCATLGAAMLIGVGFSAPPAEAAFVATIEQDGPDVILAGS
jgi:hypothetical protein